MRTEGLPHLQLGDHEVERLTSSGMIGPGNGPKVASYPGGLLVNEFPADLGLFGQFRDGLLRTTQAYRAFGG